MLTRTLPRVALLSACTIDVDEGLRPLEPGEVDQITAGDARGGDRSGLFTFTDIETSECSCREGDEDAFGCDTLVLRAEGLWVEHDDGVAEVTAWPPGIEPLRLRGGMWATGHVLAGGVESNGLGTVIHRISGTVHHERSLKASWQVRAQLHVAGTAYDCDMLVELEGLYVAPEDDQTCAFDDECHPARGHCVDSICRAGAEGDPCKYPEHCEGDLDCDLATWTCVGER